MPTFPQRKCTNPSCNYWHPPMCLNYQSESRCKYGDKCRFRHTEVDGQPSGKVEEKWCQVSGASLKESLQLGCVSQDSNSRRCILRKGCNMGSNHTVKVSTGTWHHIKIRERKGPSRGVIQKCEHHERNPCAPRCDERTQDETLQQERCAQGVAWARPTQRAI